MTTPTFEQFLIHNTLETVTPSDGYKAYIKWLLCTQKTAKANELLNQLHLINRWVIHLTATHLASGVGVGEHFDFHQADLALDSPLRHLYTHTDKVVENKRTVVWEAKGKEGRKGIEAIVTGALFFIFSVIAMRAVEVSIYVFIPVSIVSLFVPYALMRASQGIETLWKRFKNPIPEIIEKLSDNAPILITEGLTHKIFPEGPSEEDKRLVSATTSALLTTRYSAQQQDDLDVDLEILNKNLTMRQNHG